MFYIGIDDVQQLPEDDRIRSKDLRFMTNCVQKNIFLTYFICLFHLMNFIYFRDKLYCTAI